MYYNTSVTMLELQYNNTCITIFVITIPVLKYLNYKTCITMFVLQCWNYNT